MAKDIRIDDWFRNGDFNVDYSDEQHINHIVLASPGHYKQHPLIGVDITKYIHAPMSATTAAVLEREIALQLISDGGTEVVSKVNSKTGEVYAKATYN